MKIFNKRVVFLLAGLLILGILAAGCGSKSAPNSSAASSSSSTSSADSSSSVQDPDTIAVAWLPNTSGDDFKDARAEVDKIIEKATGKKVEDKLCTDYAITIEALASGNAQLAFFGAQQYIEAHNKNDKVLPLVVNSGDSGTLSDALYYSRLVVKKGNEGQYKSSDGYSIDNIVGKKMSFVSASSTSGYKVPTSTIVSYFSKKDQWKNLTAEELNQGGAGKFFSQVLFGGSHQLSLLNVLTGKSDVSAVNDDDIFTYVDLTEGKDNEAGCVYTIKKNAGDPFNNIAGAQFVVIKAMPVLNAPVAVNTGALSQKTVDAIRTALTSDEVAKNQKIFLPENASYKGMWNQPQRFVSVEDSWYNPIRELSN